MSIHARPRLARGSARIFRLSACALAAAATLSACGSSDDTASTETAQVVYKNGDILTVDKNDSVAQAVGVRDGKIIIVGTEEEVNAYVGPGTEVIDLAGKTMVPGFYDAHSHFTMAGNNAKFEVNLNSPPISTVESIADIVELLKKKKSEVGETAWITGFGYDDTLLPEHRHPTRQELDEVSTTQPILISHVSGHMAVANSFALNMAGITASTPNPDGGEIGHGPDGEPNGFLTETAVSLIKGKPALNPEQIQAGIKEASEMYASQGVTTANDGGSGAPGITALETAANSGDLAIRVVAWPFGQFSKEAADKLELTSGKVKVGGIKQIYDGSIQGYTGYLSEPYYTPYHGDASYRGFSRISKESLDASVMEAHKAGYQLFIHANGDAAIDDVLDAYSKAQAASPRSDTRHVLIHAQMAREDQLDEMKRLNAIPSFFQLHTYYWGDRHRDIFIGPDRASRISPAQSAQSRGLTYTLHADTPIVPMEPILMLWSAVNRISTSGAVIGFDQTISVKDALRAITYSAAYQNFEEVERGSIEIGKYADFAILSANPLNVAPENIRAIQVMETIVEGETVFKKPSGS